MAQFKIYTRFRSTARGADRRNCFTALRHFPDLFQQAFVVAIQAHVATAMVDDEHQAHARGGAALGPRHLLEIGVIGRDFRRRARLHTVRHPGQGSCAEGSAIHPPPVD